MNEKQEPDSGVMTQPVDVTRQESLQERLRASELRYRRLFEAAQDGILILDAETGTVVDVNPFLMKLLGYSYEAFLGKKVWELGFLKDVIASETNFVILQQKGYVRYEGLPLETKDGRRIEVEFVSNVYLVDHQRVIALSGTNVYISNTNQGWAGYNYGAANRSVISNGLMYVVTSGSSTGTVNIAGTLQGRLTIVADGTINITNHIRYSDNPSTNAGSADALGLITRQDVIVKASCPSNLDLFAHIIATGDATSSTNDGMFTVENYDVRPASSCGNLNLYGGLVENYRGPVGTSGGAGTGYVKHYIYDTRLVTNPPPHYPFVGYNSGATN